MAIIGMSCRFPGGASSVEGFWSLLCSDKDAVVEVPSARWAVSDVYEVSGAGAGKVDDIYLFYSKYIPK
jgi:acyl transferase domain-containing protein